MVGAATLAGFAAGLFVGARVGQAVVSARLAVALRAALRPRRRAHRRDALRLGARGAGLRAAPAASPPPSLGMVDGLAGAVLSTGVALGLVWLGGSVALQAPQARGLRDDIQRSSILRALNDLLPPSGPILNALARFDPFPRIDGPPVDLPAPRAAIARDPDVRARGPRRGQDPGDRVRPGGRGLGLGRPRRARGDQRARRRRPERHDGPARRVGARACRRTPSSSTPTTTSPSCASTAWRARAAHRRRARAAARRGRSSASRRTVPTTCAPRAWGPRARVITQDAYGRRAGPAIDRHPARHRAPGQLRRPDGRRARARGGDRLRRDPQRPARRLRACPTRSSSATWAGPAAARCRPGPAPAELPCGVHGQDPRHRREAVRGPGSRPRAARPVREAHRRGGQDRALAGGPRARHHLGRRPPRPARRARRVRRQVQEVADGRSADRAAHLQARRARRALREADEGRARPAAPRRHRQRRQRVRRRARGRADLHLHLRVREGQEARPAAVAELDDQPGDARGLRPAARRRRTSAPCATRPSRARRPTGSWA